MPRKAKPRIEFTGPWTCYAKPVALRGATCLHRNPDRKLRPKGRRQQMRLYCEKCNCFRSDDDNRREQARVARGLDV